MAKSKSAIRRATSPSDKTICLALAEKLQSADLEFALIEDGLGPQFQLTRSATSFDADERNLLLRLTDDVHNEVIAGPHKKGQLTIDHWKKLAATGVTLCLNLKHLNLPIAARRRNYLQTAAAEAAALVSEQPSVTIETLQTMIDASRCVFWKLPVALILEALSKTDLYVHNKDVKKGEDRSKLSKQTSVTDGGLEALRTPARDLSLEGGASATRQEIAADALRGLTPEGLLAALQAADLPKMTIETIRDWTADQLGNVPTKRDFQIVARLVGKKGGEATSIEDKQEAGKRSMAKRSKKERSELGKKGAEAAAASMSAEEKSARAKKAAEARWKKRKE